jgi:amino acid adenylation domain-containing protein
MFISIAEAIFSHALEQPSAPAVVSDGRTVGFGELIQRSAALSKSIRERLAGRVDAPIAVATDDTYQLVVGALAAWMANCGYLPIDPSAPTDRWHHMLTEAQVPVVTANALGMSRLPAGSWQTLPLDEHTHKQLPSGESTFPTPPSWNVRPEDLAYVIYTSGSTGKPKGVAATHANLNNFVAWYQSNFGLKPGDRVTQIMALTFDVAVAEIWPHLSMGGTVYAPERSIGIAPERLRDYLVQNEITMCEAPMLVAEQLIQLNWPPETKLRTLQTGGETLRVFPSPELPFRVFNNYGMTECTIDALSGVIPVGQTPVSDYPSVGSPVQGAIIFLLDAELKPVPDGERGEIYIGGPGVTRGYVGRPELTAERFITNPFAEGGPLIYRTGDLGRRLPTGEYQFCGRVDDQIKLRGYRIEPSEIVAALLRHPRIKSAAITTLGEAAEKQLIAYIVPSEDVTASDLRSHLAPLLPSYMVPDQFVRLESLPVTVHGKTDFRALPPPTDENSLTDQKADVSPETEIQNLIASAFSEALKGRQFGLNDNFFHNGGNSLLAGQAMRHLEDLLQITFPFRIIFDNPTVGELAAAVEQCIMEAIANGGGDVSTMQDA